MEMRRYWEYGKNTMDERYERGVSDQESKQTKKVQYVQSVAHNHEFKVKPVIRLMG